MKINLKLIVTLVLNSLFWLGIYDNIINLDHNNCEMTYMFEYPQYLEVKLDNNPINYYKLFVYGEGHYSQTLARGKYEGIPVLFIPGNQGSHKQVRSLASVALRKAQEDGQFHFNYFSVDFNEEIGAFFGPVLEQQTRFVGHVIRSILDLYKNSQRKPSSVVLVGHSMGGLIARAVVGPGGIPPKLVSIIITLATPHARPVIIPDSSLSSFYETVNGHWSERRNSSLKDIVFVTIGGGKKDVQVPSALTTSQFADVDQTLSSVPLCWLTTDHLAIVWCKQLVLAVTRALFKAVDASTLQISPSKSIILSAFNQHLSERFGEYNTFSDIRNKIEKRIKSPEQWTELKTKQHSERFQKPLKPKLIAIPLLYDRENQHVSIVFHEFDSRSMVIACKANVSDNILAVTSGENLHRYSRLIPGNQKEVNIDLLSMQGRDFTHLAVVIEPSSEQSFVDIDISDWESRNLVVPAPFFMSTSPLWITEATPSQSLTLNVTIEGFTEMWQTFTLSLKSLNDCSNDRKPPMVSLRTSWGDGWEQVMSNKSPLEFNIQVITPSPSEYEGSVEVHIVKSPVCDYSISLKQNHRGIFERIVLLFGSQSCAYVACHLLIVFSNQHKVSSSTRTSIFTHLFSLTPISVVPFAKLAAFGLSKLGGIESDRSYLEKNRINIEVMPIVLFLSTLPLTIAIVCVVRVLVAALSRAVLLCASRTFKQSIKTEEVGSGISISFLIVSSTVAVALFSIGASTCGSLTLFIASGIYGIKVVKMYVTLQRSRSSPNSAGAAEFEEASVDFHFTVLLLSLFVSFLNLPSLVVWIKSVRSQNKLESDPSLIVCAAVVVALALFHQTESINPNKKFRRILGHMIHLSSILVILFGTIYVYRVAAIISFTLLIVALHQFMAPE